MTDSNVAYEALNLSKQNARDIERHEEICAERYLGIHNAIDEIKSILKWAGTSLFGLIMTVLGFLVIQQLNANAKLDDKNDIKVERLERQLAEERAHRVIQVTPEKEPYGRPETGPEAP